MVKNLKLYSEDEKGRLIGTYTLKVKKPRKRKGCDLCKKDDLTECFIGMLGNVLWFCLNCKKTLIKNKKVEE